MQPIPLPVPVSVPRQVLAQVLPLVERLMLVLAVWMWTHLRVRVTGNTQRKIL